MTVGERRKEVSDARRLTGLESAMARTGEIGSLLRETDWSATPLGPLETWPRSLTHYVAMILELPSPSIIFWGPEQTQIYNDGYKTIMGPRHPQYFGAPYRECWPDTYPLIYPWMREVLEEGKVKEVDSTHITVTRYGFEEEAYFTFTFSPLRDDDGNIAGILQPVVEVTDTVLSERRSRTLHALAARAGSVDAARDAIEALSANPNDVPFALIYLWDEQAQKLELAGRTDNLVTCTEHLAGFSDSVQRAFSSNVALELDDVERMLGGASIGPWPEATRSALVLPVSQPTSDALAGVVVFGISPRLSFDNRYRGFLGLAAGQIARAIADARALEEVKKRAEALAQLDQAKSEAELQKQHLATLFMDAPAPIVILRSREMIIELVNHHACRLWGREYEEVIGRPLLDVLPELRGQVFEGLLDRVLETGEPYIGRETLASLARAGHDELDDVYLNFVYSPLRNVGGEIDGILVMAFDVTDQVRARERVSELRDRAESAGRAKDEFLAMLGHELRNPLAPIITALELMRLRGDGAFEKERAVIERQAKQLIGLVNDLLDVSRITRGKIKLNNAPVEIAEVVGHAIEMASPLLEQRQHHLKVSVPEKGLVVNGDAGRLAQVVANLLSNAAKYTEPGGLIAVSARRAGDEILLKVTDNGIGIDEELLPKVFDMFAQVRQSSDRSQGGLGLGLAIVRNLVMLHGGSVSVRSDGVGCGSEFTVCLPVAPRLPAPVAEKEYSAPRKGLNGHRRVLVVDDNEDAAEALGEYIRELGYRTRVAYDGPAALRIAEQFRPDAVLLDIGLPAMDGYELAWRLRELSNFRSVCLIAVTGYGQASERERTAAAGFDAHLVKPIDLAALAETLQQLQAD